MNKHTPQPNNENTVLIVTANPNKESSHTYANAAVVEASVKAQGFSVVRKEAYDFPYFSADNSAFDECADLLSRVKHVVFVGPMWNYTMPGAMKNWIDSSLRAREHFYFSESGMPKGLIPNLQVHVVFTAGGPHWLYKLMPWNNQFTGLIKKIFKLCGVKKFHELSLCGRMKFTEDKQLKTFHKQIMNHKFQ